MPARKPHYLLFCEAVPHSDGTWGWKFAVRPSGCDEVLSASDAEPAANNSRLELLAVVRGLESLDGPSRVTLLTRSAYVCRGIRRELSAWRENCWQWDRFGKRVPIRDCDLWQRLDRALRFHDVACRAWRLDELAQADCPAAEAALPSIENNEGEAALLVVPRPRKYHHWRRWTLADALRPLRQAVLDQFANLWHPPFTRAA